MKRHYGKAILLCIVMAFVAACSTHPARRPLKKDRGGMALNAEAWQAARTKLKAMCPEVPTVEEYKRGKAFAKADGKDPFGGCDVRIIKATYGPVFDHWQWDWLPSYRNIVAVHVEEMRKRVTPRIYDEYMHGLARYLAERTDKGEIAPKQFAAAFNEGWKWMLSRIQSEAILLQPSLQPAQELDAAIGKILGAVAAEMATVATTALSASVTAAASSPSAVHCVANRMGAFVTVICQ
jgi:hypothetical protein